MGYRIHRAIGWGIDFKKMQKHCLVDLNEEDGLYGFFNKFSDKDLTISKEESRVVWDTKNVYSILERRLLSKNFTSYGTIKATGIGQASDLFEQIMNPDKTYGFVFFPSLYQKKKWFRYDDDMDYAFERWRSKDVTRMNDDGPRDFIKYVAYGHYPWTNFLMDRVGNPVPWEPFYELQQKPEIVPQVPYEIRWYLKKMEILDDTGVNELRPVVAQWWC